MCLEKAIERLERNFDKLAEKAETSGDINNVFQSNSFRRTAKEKKNELKALDENINKILKDLKENFFNVSVHSKILIKINKRLISV